MIATNRFRAGAVAVMLLGTSPGRYRVLYVALIAESSGGVIYMPAWLARTRAIVGTGTLLSGANSLNAGADGAVRLPGGTLGGIVLTSMASTSHVTVSAAALSCLIVPRMSAIVAV